MAGSKSAKGSHKVSNTRRSEKRKNRYQAGLRERIMAFNKLEKQHGSLTPRQATKRSALERMLDHPRKKAGYGRRRR